MCGALEAQVQWGGIIVIDDLCVPPCVWRNWKKKNKAGASPPPHVELEVGDKLQTARRKQIPSAKLKPVKCNQDFSAVCRRKPVGRCDLNDMAMLERGKEERTNPHQHRLAQAGCSQTLEHTRNDYNPEQKFIQTTN